MEEEALSTDRPIVDMAPWDASFAADIDDSWGEDGDVEPPDSVDHVIEVSNLMGCLSADRLVSIAQMRRDGFARSSRRTSREIVERSVRLELAAALRITEYAAGEMLALAEAVVDRHPVLIDAVRRADITEQHARILVAGIDSVETEHREQVRSEGLALAVELPVGVFRRALNDLVESLREVSLTARHEAEVGMRRVFVEPGADAMAWLHLYAPAVEIQAAFGRATAMAKRLRTRDGETRTLDQARADVLCDLLIDGASCAHPVAVRGIRASVVVTVPVLALLGDGDAVPKGCDPATVEGIGPIPLPAARRLCGGSGGWMRVLTHPETGMVLSVGRDRYQPPPELAKLVKWRAERCMAPGCGMPASRCQIDHSIAWVEGGVTALWNNAPMCQGHHTIKHDGGWSITHLERGAIEWVSPTGRTYVVEPERRIPVFRTSRGSEGEEPAAPF